MQGDAGRCREIRGDTVSSLQVLLLDREGGALHHLAHLDRDSGRGRAMGLGVGLGVRGRGRGIAHRAHAPLEGLLVDVRYARSLRARDHDVAGARLVEKE